MIVLTRNNGKAVVVNADLIETVEAAGDGTTVVTLTTGNLLGVEESIEAVRDAVLAYRRHIAGTQ
ncbi:MAG: flagellar FlbD family protein [Candidatus Eremiobacteraeota bacterium]|nr:flagellar FlbD family protein [Candidatus Eremiobacteraeota bacterium]